ncbi:Stealth CR1 domain-containing protein [Providencia rettgeri]
MNKIDFVIPWVDHNDPVWQKDFKKYNLNHKEEDSSFERYRDWGLLKYWFRGVENNAPWVNKIHFITYGHVPTWLNINHPKINIVKHDSYIPQKYLPVFSSHPIEIFINRIPELSEKFVYFNDDMYLLNKVEPTDFFRNEKPCDIFSLNAISPTGISHILLNNLSVISSHFNKRNVMRKNINKWLTIKYKEKLFKTLLLLPWPSFTGFFDHHLPQPFLKKTFDDVWDNNSEILLLTAQSRFRNINDVNQYLFRYWHLCKGDFYPKDYSDGKYFTLNNENINTIEHCILNKKKKIITINDSDVTNFDYLSDILLKSFSYIYKKKSNFEL